MKSNRTSNAFVLAAGAIAMLAGPVQAGPTRGQLGILTPETLAGNNPATGAPWAAGDTYRFAFFTSATTTAESADISTYNTFVQDLANASAGYDIGVDDGVTWKAICSTSDVDAIDNTSTTWTDASPGSPIFLLDGSTLVASDYRDLWDGDIQHIINLTEQGIEYTWWPWTGTYLDGTASEDHAASGGALGSAGEVGQGQSDSTTNWIWRIWTMDPPSFQHNMYALSDPLVIVDSDPHCPSGLSASEDAAGVALTWRNGEEMPISVRIRRNMQEIAGAAPADPPTYTDADAQPGLLDYELDFTMPGEPCEPLTTTFDACITDLTAMQTAVDGVVLTWTNNLVYDGIEVARGGVVLQPALHGTAVTYTDVDPAPGFVTYSVVPTNGTCVPTTVAIDVFQVHLELTPQDVVLPVGESVQLSAMAVGDGGSREDLTTAATGTIYTSDPAGIVTIDENGLLEAIAVGETTVTATNGGLSDTTTVSVRDDLFPVDIGNSGFEDPVVADGDYVYVASEWSLGHYDSWVDPTVWIPGWFEAAGVWNPDAAWGFTDGAFNGENTLWVSSTARDDGGASQVLTEPLQADTEYVLIVQVGNSLYNESDETAPYRLELLAGGVLLASQAGPSPVADTWEAHTLIYNSVDHPDQVGELLEIRLIAEAYVDLDGVSEYEVDFDEVFLFAQSVSDVEICDNEVDDNQNGLVDCQDPLCKDDPACPGGPTFVRGDSDSNGSIELTDGLVSLIYLYQGGEPPQCFDAADADDNGTVELTDAVNIFLYLFSGGNAPEPPTPSTTENYPGIDCGMDPTADSPEPPINGELGCIQPSPVCAP